METIRYNKEQVGVIQTALFAHLNHYRRSLEEAIDEEFKNIAKEKIQRIEEVIKEMGA